MDESAEEVELEQRIEQASRVAAIDIAKASAMVCTRLPADKNPDRRVQRTWAVGATTAAINELADHLVCQGVQLVVMEATGVFYKPFFYPTPPPDDDHPHRTPLLDRLDEIPGVGRDAAQVIIAEIGVDMTCFPTAGHLASWSKLTPRAIQSGNRNTHGKTGKGNGWLKGALGQAAVNASRTKTFLGARYRRIIKHAPKKKAQVAIARSILEIAWFLISDPDARFVDLGPDWHDRHVNRTRKTRQAVRELEHLGYTVSLTAAA